MDRKSDVSAKKAVFMMTVVAKILNCAIFWERFFSKEGYRLS